MSEEAIGREGVYELPVDVGDKMTSDDGSVELVELRLRLLVGRASSTSASFSSDAAERVAAPRSWGDNLVDDL